MTAQVSEFTVKNLVRLRMALDHHNARCGTPARAFLLNPIDHGLLGWTVLWGVPVEADRAINVKRFRVDCDDYSPNHANEQRLAHAA